MDREHSDKQRTPESESVVSLVTLVIDWGIGPVFSVSVQNLSHTQIYIENVLVQFSVDAVNGCRTIARLQL